MTTAETAVAGQLERLSARACQTLLGATTTGRIAFVLDGLPCVLPVNYRMLGEDSDLVLLVRTQPGHTIDSAPSDVAFEIDGIDDVHHAGWSVLVRGTLQHLDDDEIEKLTPRSDPEPWPRPGKTAWLAIKAHTVTGRRLHAAEGEWAFSSEAYL